MTFAASAARSTRDAPRRARRITAASLGGALLPTDAHALARTKSSTNSASASLGTQESCRVKRAFELVEQVVLHVASVLQHDAILFFADHHPEGVAGSLSAHELDRDAIIA